MSAESLIGTDAPFGSETGPNAMEGRPVLPPLPGSSTYMGAIYRCDYQDCSAAPFSTQYLLK